MAWFKGKPTEAGVEAVAVLERPSQRLLEAKSEESLKEYAELANKAGAYVAQLENECFKRFLNEHDIPVFNLREVIKYMDQKAKDDKEANGWLWRPYRSKDDMKRMIGEFTRPRSDFYHHDHCIVYDKPIPLHALKKVALIEEHFKDKIKLFVSDYAAALPDPFLMAVVVHSSDLLTKGEGRYVIDVWDEPGFGLIQQLK